MLLARTRGLRMSTDTDLPNLYPRDSWTFIAQRRSGIFEGVLCQNHEKCLDWPCLDFHKLPPLLTLVLMGLRCCYWLVVRNCKLMKPRTDPARVPKQWTKPRNICKTVLNHMLKPRLYFLRLQNSQDSHFTSNKMEIFLNKIVRFIRWNPHAFLIIAARPIRFPLKNKSKKYMQES